MPAAAPTREGPSYWYGYNAYGLQGRTYSPLGLGGKRDQVFAPVQESDVLHPSEMIALGDAMRGWNNCYQDGLWLLERASDAKERYGSTARVRKLHSGNANVLFCDGHVTVSSLSSLFADRSDTALAGWNRDGQAHRERLE